MNLRLQNWNDAKSQQGTKHVHKLPLEENWPYNHSEEKHFSSPSPFIPCTGFFITFCKSLCTTELRRKHHWKWSHPWSSANSCSPSSPSSPLSEPRKGFPFKDPPSSSSPWGEYASNLVIPGPWASTQSVRMLFGWLWSKDAAGVSFAICESTASGSPDGYRMQAVAINVTTTSNRISD